MQIAEKYRPIFKKKAEENLKQSGENFGKGSQKSSNPIEKIHTRDELAKIAKVSHDTYGKAKKIIDLEKEATEGKVNLTENEKQVIEKAKKDEIKVKKYGFIEVRDYISLSQKYEVKKYTY